MIYHLIWKKGEGWGKGTVHTWDEKVVDATPALASLVGRSFYAVEQAAERLNAKVTVETDDGNDRVVLRRMHGVMGNCW